MKNFNQLTAMKTITEFISKQNGIRNTTLFDLIYNIITNDEWIYVTKEMVVSWFGYKESKNTMSHFYAKLKEQYQNDIDFKQVDQNNEIVKKVTNLLIVKNDLADDNIKKYYLVTNKILILLLIKSKDTKYKILQEQNEFGFLYFVYEKDNENFFKIGFTNNDLEKRLSCLQTGNRRVLKIYKFIECKNATELEQITHNKFEKYKVVNEWYKITKKDIDNYIINYDLANLTKNLTI